MPTSVSPSIDGRLYRVGLWLCPSGFRHEHADEMARDFDEAHGEATSMGRRALWRLRLLIAIDLVRTFAVQWTRTGLPVIWFTSLIVSLAVVEALATLARRARFEIPRNMPDADVIGLVLLATTAVCVIAMTIVLTLWVGRQVRPRRR